MYIYDRDDDWCIFMIVIMIMVLNSRGPFYDIFHPLMFKLMLMIPIMNDNAVEKQRVLLWNNSSISVLWCLLVFDIDDQDVDDHDDEW